jgi:ubiquitin C-terminal hydrolase
MSAATFVEITLGDVSTTFVATSESLIFFLVYVVMFSVLRFDDLHCLCRSVAQSLVIMNGLFLTIASKRKKPDISWSTFGCVNDEQDLLELVIADLEHCAEQSHSMPYPERGVAPSAESASVSLVRGNVGTMTRGGSMSSIQRGDTDPVQQQQELLNHRLSFISSILEVQGASLSVEHVEALWQVLMQNDGNRMQRAFSAAWFENLLSSELTGAALIPCLSHLFHNLICKINPEDVHEGEFSLFRRAMVCLNLKEGNLQRGKDPKSLLVTTKEELIGTESLWNFAVLAADQEVAQQCVVLINDVYQKFPYEHYPAGDDTGQARLHGLISRCMTHIEASKDLSVHNGGVVVNERRILRCVQVLKHILLEFEETNAHKLNVSKVRKHSLRLRGETINIRLQRFGPPNEAIHAAVDSGMTLLALRELIGKTIGEHTNVLRMIARGIELKEWSKTLGELKLLDGETVHFTVTRNGIREVVADEDDEGQSQPTPHQILSVKYFDRIFELLEAPTHVAAEVWGLIMMMPTNEALLESMRVFKPNWDRSFKEEGNYSLLYFLQIVELLLEESSEPDASFKWRDRFISIGGLAKLLRIILSPRLATPEEHDCAILTLLLKLVYSLIIDWPEKRRFQSTLSDLSNAASTSEGNKRMELDGSGEDVEFFFSAGKNSPAGCDLRLLMHGLLNILHLASQQGPQDLGANHVLVVRWSGKLLTACVLKLPSAVAHLHSFEAAHPAWISDTLQCSRDYVRYSVAQALLHVASESGHDEAMDYSSLAANTNDACLHPVPYFLERAMRLVLALDAECNSCSELLELSNELLAKAQALADALTNKSRVALPRDTAQKIVKTIDSLLDSSAHALAHKVKTSSPSEEYVTSHTDQTLVCCLTLLRTFASLRPTLRRSLGSRMGGEGLVQYLVQDGVFKVPPFESVSGDMQGGAKCQTTRARHMMLELLYTLVQDCPDNHEDLVQQLLPHHLSREFRLLSMYKPTQLEKAAVGYVGLKNLGATCYMNSLHQQLFHVPEFRGSILQVPVPEEDIQTSLVFQMQTMFAHLQESHKQFYDPWEFCKTYTDYEGQPVNVRQQMDVDEYFNMLFDKLETGTKDTPQASVLRDNFGGKVVNQIICKDTVKVGDKEYGNSNPYKSEREETFYTISLEVKHKRTILESLDAFVEGEVLEGDNKYFCEEANKKVDAVKRVCIKELPRTLILHLKRFEFDFDNMKKVKVNDSCEFPMRLDMAPYTLANIERREALQAEARRSGLDEDCVADRVGCEDSPDSEYQLVGVLVHRGTADSGHYFSYIKERSPGVPGNSNDGQWLLFNDTLVEPFDESEIGSACYGGTETLADGEEETGMQLVSKTYSAYMLVYERVSASNDALRQKMLFNYGKVSVPIPELIHKAVWGDTIQFLSDKNMYDPSYAAFVHRIVSLAISTTPAIEPAQENDGESDCKPVVPANSVTTRGSALAAELAIRMLMDCVLHSWDLGQVDVWVSLIKQMIPSHVEHLSRSHWVLENFVSNHEDPATRFVILCHWFLKSVVLHRDAGCRASIAGLLVHIVKNLSVVERSPQSSTLRAAPPPGDPFLAHGKGPAQPAAQGEPAQETASGEASDGSIDPNCGSPGSPSSVPGSTSDSVSGQGHSVGESTVKELANASPARESKARTHVASGVSPRPQMPVVQVVKFLDRVLELLPELPVHWRHLAEYFQCLRDIANIGLPEKTFMLSRATVARCIDMYLHEDSPWVHNHRYHNKMGDKFNLPDFSCMLELVSLLVRSSEIAPPTDDHCDRRPAPTSLPIAGHLEKTCICLVKNQTFLTRILMEQVNLHHTLLLLQHLSWEDTDASLIAIQVLCDVVEETNEDRYPTLFKMLKSLLLLQDSVQSFRTEKFVTFFVRALLSNHSYPEACVKCFQFMAELVSTMPQIRRHFMQNILAPRRDRHEIHWLEDFLIRQDVDEVPQSAELFVHSLLTPSFLQASETTGLDDPRAEHCDKITRDLFEHLISLDVESLAGLVVDRVLDNERVRCIQPYSLGPYVRCLVFIVLKTPPKLHLQRLLEYFPVLHQTWNSLNELEGEMDQGKAELTRLFCELCERYPEALQLIADDTPGIAELFMENYIMIRLGRAHVTFNRHYMPFFYRLLQLCCNHSDAFAEVSPNPTLHYKSKCLILPRIFSCLALTKLDPAARRSCGTGTHYGRSRILSSIIIAALRQQHICLTPLTQHCLPLSVAHSSASSVKSSSAVCRSLEFFQTSLITRHCSLPGSWRALFARKTITQLS